MLYVKNQKLIRSQKVKEREDYLQYREGYHDLGMLKSANFAVGDALANFAKYKFTSRMHNDRLNVATLIVLGTRDATIPPQQTPELHKLLPFGRNSSCNTY